MAGLGEQLRTIDDKVTNVDKQLGELIAQLQPVELVKRVRALEIWRAWVLGAAAVVMFLEPLILTAVRQQ